MSHLIYGLDKNQHNVAFGVGGATVSASISRPENTTAYTAGDVIGQADSETAANAGSAILTFSKVGLPGRAILIAGADLRVDLSSVTSGMTTFRLHLYDASPTAILDNAAWDLGGDDRDLYLGYVDLGSPADMGSTLYTQADQVNKQVKLAASSHALYGVLVTNGAYTPASATTMRVRLHTVDL